MHINELNRYQREKDKMMRNEGTHPANHFRQDEAVASRQQGETERYVEHDGDYENNHLATRQMGTNSDDRLPLYMPRVAISEKSKST